MLRLALHWANGDTTYTRINATIEEATRYYIGKVFNIGITADNLQLCVGVEIFIAE